MRSAKQKARRRVLITGAGGHVAAELVPRLEADYDLTLWDRKEIPVHGRVTDAVDLADLAAVRATMSDFDAVVHLAIASPREYLRRGASAAAARDSYEAAMMRANNDGTLHAMRAAAEAGVGRFVYMSSLTVVTMGLHTGTLAVAQAPAPRDVYACTKFFGECLGRHFAASTTMRVACLRLGQPYPVADAAVMRDVMDGFQGRLPYLVHHDDIARAVQCALTADIPSFLLANLVSAQAADFYPESEICSAELGFAPARSVRLDGTVAHATGRAIAS